MIISRSANQKKIDPASFMALSSLAQGQDFKNHLIGCGKLPTFSQKEFARMPEFSPGTKTLASDLQPVKNRDFLELSSVFGIQHMLVLLPPEKGEFRCKLQCLKFQGKPDQTHPALAILFVQDNHLKMTFWDMKEMNFDPRIHPLDLHRAHIIQGSENHRGPGPRV